jgi:hypothetical protein
VSSRFREAKTGTHEHGVAIAAQKPETAVFMGPGQPLRGFRDDSAVELDDAATVPAEPPWPGLKGWA